MFAIRNNIIVWRVRVPGFLVFSNEIYRKMFWRWERFKHGFSARARCVRISMLQNVVALFTTIKLDNSSRASRRWGELLRELTLVNLSKTFKLLFMSLLMIIAVFVYTPDVLSTPIFRFPFSPTEGGRLTEMPRRIGDPQTVSRHPIKYASTVRTNEGPSRVQPVPLCIWQFITFDVSNTNDKPFSLRLILERLILTLSPWQKNPRFPGFGAKKPLTGKADCKIMAQFTCGSDMSLKSIQNHLLVAHNKPASPVREPSKLWRTNRKTGWKLY